MRKGQLVTTAAQKLAKNHIKNGISDAINPISKEIAGYVLRDIEKDMPDVLTNIQELVTLILEQANEIDFLKVYPDRDGLAVEIDLEQINLLAQEIISSIVYSPHVFEEGMDYFDNIDLNVEDIQKIVVDNIRKLTEN